jgi:hypothetical protein
VQKWRLTEPAGTPWAPDILVTGITNNFTTYDSSHVQVNDGRKRQVKKSKSTTTLFEQGLKVSSKLVRKMRSAVLSVGI